MTIPASSDSHRKRYLFIGAVENSAHCLRLLLGMSVNMIDIMCPFPEAAKQNSDYYDLGKIARELERPVYYFDRIGNEVEHIRALCPDVIFVLGLSQLIPKEILAIPTIGCLGIHPALLPANRGRHPIIWAIVNGMRQSGVTLFWLDEGADTGDIWAQEPFLITDSDDARSVYTKVTQLTLAMLEKGVPRLEKGIITRAAQDHTKANVWRKRTIKDGEIDWRMSSKRIYDLVRALAKPYVGAHCIYQGEECKIWKVKAGVQEGAYDNIEPGKVIGVDNREITVKTGDGCVVLIEHELPFIPRIAVNYETPQ